MFLSGRGLYLQTKPSIGFSANKALCWGLYLQIKPSIVNVRLQTRSCCVGVVLVEGFIIQGSRALILWAFLFLSGQIVNDFVGSFLIILSINVS